MWCVLGCLWQPQALVRARERERMDGEKLLLLEKAARDLMVSRVTAAVASIARGVAHCALITTTHPL